MTTKGWSLNTEDWQTLEALFREHNGWIPWRSVTLNLNHRFLVPDAPGVYGICATPPFTTGIREAKGNVQTMFQELAVPLYVGMSESSLQRRFSDHCQRPSDGLKKAKRCYSQVKLTFWFAELTQEHIRLAEGLLIKCFGPPVNQVQGTIKGTVGNPISL